MLLGQILERLEQKTLAAETLIALGDRALMADVESVGRQFGEDRGAYASGAARRFAQLASDEDWLSLMAELARTDDPGAACLRHMLGWSLRRDKEGGHGEHCSCHGDANRGIKRA